MMEKSDLDGEDVGCTPTLFHSLYHHVQRCSVRFNWEDRYITPLPSLPQYVLCALLHNIQMQEKLKENIDSRVEASRLFAVTDPKMSDVIHINPVGQYL